MITYKYDKISLPCYGFDRAEFLSWPWTRFVSSCYICWSPCLAGRVLDGAVIEFLSSLGILLVMQ